MSVRPAAGRRVTRTGQLDSRHSFAYGPHAEPGNTHFGLLLVSNEDRLAAGAGFQEHPHRDVEVLTWVLAGRLSHRDSAGHTGTARPGVVQRMSAGAGVRHAEHAGPEPAHYVQMWLWPGAAGGAPAYDTVDVTADLAAGRPVSVAPLRQPAATLHAARLAPGRRLRLPAAAYLHVFVARGTVEVDGVGTLAAGDAARLTGTGPVDVVGLAVGVPDAEVLAWEMRTGLPVG